MTRDEIRAVVLQSLGEIAPEADPGSLKPDVGFRDQLDLALDLNLGTRAAEGREVLKLVRQGKSVGLGWQTRRDPRQPSPGQ